MISQHYLARLFAEGSDVGALLKASNVEAESPEGSDDLELREFEAGAGLVDAYLVGYNWAIYAARLAEGSVVMFPDWADYSQSTKQQLSELRSGFLTVLPSDRVIESEGTPQIRPEHKAESNQSRSMHASPGY